MLKTDRAPLGKTRSQLEYGSNQLYFTGSVLQVPICLSGLVDSSNRVPEEQQIHEN